MLLTLGYTWKINSGNHVSRDLLSIASYIILYMVQQILGLLAIMVYLVSSFGNPFSAEFMGRVETFMNSMDNGTSEAVASYVQGIVGVALGINVVIVIVLAVVILRRLNHHLDLE